MAMGIKKARTYLFQQSYFVPQDQVKSLREENLPITFAFIIDQNCNRLSISVLDYLTYIPKNCKRIGI